MFKRLTLSFLLFLACTLALACNATPLPQPPLIESSLLELRSGNDATTLTGQAGAVSEGFVGEVRVTTAAGRNIGNVETDGSFIVSVRGAMISDVHYVELLRGGEELFTVAVQDLGAGTVVAPPGPDGDGDGSPDAIDCAPADEALVGQQCTCLSDDLICDGLDDDCDGLIDEDCDLCRSDTDCAAGAICEAGMCVVR